MTISTEEFRDRLKTHVISPIQHALGQSDEPYNSGWERIQQHVEEHQREKEHVAQGLCPASGLPLHADGEGVPGSLSCDMCDCFGYKFEEVVGDVKLKRQYECYVLNRGWRANPIGKDVVTAWRQRWVADWEPVKISPRRLDEQLPYHVQKAMGVYYDEETGRWGTLSAVSDSERT